MLLLQLLLPCDMSWLRSVMAYTKLQCLKSAYQEKGHYSIINITITFFLYQIAGFQKTSISLDVQKHSIAVLFWYATEVSIAKIYIYVAWAQISVI